MELKITRAKKIGFLDLPGELRNVIYAYALENVETDPQIPISRVIVVSDETWNDASEQEREAVHKLRGKLWSETAANAVIW